MCLHKISVLVVQSSNTLTEKYENWCYRLANWESS